MSKPILIIDPGHGGKDPGGGSNEHWKEKDMALKISLYQYERFQELGVPVALTRDDDRTLDSDERTRIVRESGAVFCISNHLNAYNGKARGWEIIHSIYAEGNLAREIGREFEKLPIPKRRIFTRRLIDRPNLDYYFMHRETGEVATNIIEYGFADNPDDADYLLNNWKVMAEAVVKAFCSFIGHPYHPPEGSQEDGYPPETERWKKELVDWMYEKGLLDSEEWKERIEQPVPLWALAAILKDHYEMVKGEG